MNKQVLPEVGKRYHFFEDGKSGPSRHFIIEITNIVPFEDITDGELLDAYDAEVEECDFLYAPETDYFIYGRKVLEDNTLDEEDFIFIRTDYGGWFSFGHLFDDGLLDVDNSKYNAIAEYWEQDGKNYDEASQTKGLI